MVKTCTHGDNNGRHILFGYDFFAIGKRPNGTECFMEVPEPWCGADTFNGEKWQDEQGFWNGQWRKDCRYSGREPQDGRPKEGRSESSWDHNVTNSLLPATVEIVDAVLAFEMRLKALGEEMERRFAPDMVQETIQQVQKAFTFPLALPEKKTDGATHGS